MVFDTNKKDYSTQNISNCALNSAPCESEGDDISRKSRRRSMRVQVDEPATLWLAEPGPYLRCIVIDESTSGVRIGLSDESEFSDIKIAQLYDGGVRNLKLRWLKGDQAGFSFLDELEKEFQHLPIEKTDRRRGIREQFNRSAELMLLKSQKVLRCHIIDVSPDGLQLCHDVNTEIPENLIVTVSEEIRYFARRRWVNGTQCGLEFVSKNGDKPFSIAPAQPIASLRFSLKNLAGLVASLHSGIVLNNDDLMMLESIGALSTTNNLSVLLQENVILQEERNFDQVLLNDPLRGVQLPPEI